MRNSPRSNWVFLNILISKTWKILRENRSTKFWITAVLKCHISLNHMIVLIRECILSIIIPIRTSIRIWEISMPKRESWNITLRMTRWTSPRDHKSKMNKLRLVDKRNLLAPKCVKVEERLLITMARCYRIALAVSQTMLALSPKQLIKTSTVAKYSIKLSN